MWFGGVVLRGFDVSVIAYELSLALCNLNTPIFLTLSEFEKLFLQ